MNDWIDQAFVLQVRQFREIDLWLKLFVKSKGLLTAFAFGGTKSKHRFCGCLDVLNTLQCRLKTSKRGQFYTLEEATLLCGPKVLRTNWSRMGIAANCLKFLETLGTTPETCGQVFALLEDLRFTLEDKNTISNLFPLLFRFHLACIEGYRPDLLHCSYCSQKITDNYAIFIVSKGEMLCSTCQRTQSIQHDHLQIPINLQIILLMTMVATTFPSVWSEQGLTWSEKQSCARAIDGFIEYHLGIVWDHGYFKRR